MKTTTVGAFDAKTRLSELLDLAERGEVVIITRHGKPVAKLSPCDAVRDSQRINDAISGLLSLRARFLAGGPPLTLDEIQAARDEGRR
ncbi:MAG: type II toxin-antitoxin system prevent-host-death family antitoxin [Planctomycetes bacterium]|nr:type II toxin-antitoxin system prevent-host-death family antitoxin [Planctomycetota bacterium]